MNSFILMDIEGTTTPITFVHDVLFPYAKQHLKTYLVQHKNDDEIKKHLMHLSEILSKETGKMPDLKDIAETLCQWIVEDRKQTDLKSIQGLIWEEGYQAGDLKSNVYADVVPNLQKWQKAGAWLGIYSSGSIHAQKLLFKHTQYGDITPMLSHYFDTTTGHKREKSSYDKIKVQILKDLALPKNTPLFFLSDIEEELDAASEAGFLTKLIVRKDSPAKTDPTSKKHQWVTDFNELKLFENEQLL